MVNAVYDINDHSNNDVCDNVDLLRVCVTRNVGLLASLAVYICNDV